MSENNMSENNMSENNMSENNMSENNMSENNMSENNMSEDKTQDNGGPDERIALGSPLLPSTQQERSVPMSAEKPRDPRGADQEFTIGSPLPHDPDAPPVGPTFAGPFAIGGGVEGVNDAGSEPIDVRITRYEAEVLLRHWFERQRDTYEFCFIYETSGSDDWRESRLCELPTRRARAPRLRGAPRRAQGGGPPA